jgi:Ca2+-binding EF-hand superfamily protein
MCASQFPGQTRSFRAMIGLAVFVTLSPAGAEERKQTDPGSAEDVQDVLFLHDSGPVLIRLHILLDGKPYPLRWNEYLTRWFRFLDSDADGFLDGKEAARAPYPRVLEDLLSNPYSYALREAPPFEDFDRDRDKRVSLDEFLRYYYVAGQPGSTPAPSPPRRGPLWFRKMDRNGDGDVSQREFLGSRDDFRRMDTDGDGLISLEEAQRADVALRKK